MQPLVSIIIPTYNRAHLIVETLDSIVAQTYQNWECIVVDDGSADGTNAVIQSYCEKDARFQYHQRPKSRPAGGNAARNYGFELSNGDYVQWFDSDDIMLPNFLKEKIACLKPELKVIIASGYSVDENLHHKEQISLFQTEELFKEYVLWNIKILTPSVLFKKEFLLQHELFNTALTRGQESELFSRLFFNLSSNSYCIINKPLFLYRNHQNNITFRSKSYIPSFKKSQAFIALGNLKRSILLDDKKLIKHFNSIIIKLFFNAVKNKDKDTSNYVLYELPKIINLVNKVYAIKFKAAGFMVRSIGKSSYRMEKYFKSYSF